MKNAGYLDRLQKIAKIFAPTAIKNYRNDVISNYLSRADVDNYEALTVQSKKYIDDMVMAQERSLQKAINSNVKSASEILQAFYLVSPFTMVDLFDSIKGELKTPEYEDCLSFVWLFGLYQGRGLIISKKKWLELFKKADKEALMSENDYKEYASFPDKVTVYRGIVGDNKRSIKAMSWTIDKSEAELFAKYPGGYVYETTVNKSSILAYFGEEREESEVILDYTKIRNPIVIEHVTYEEFDGRWHKVITPIKDSKRCL